VALAVIVAVAGSACGAPDRSADPTRRPTATGLPATPAPSGPSAIPFAPMTYPDGDAAPCGQTEPPDTVHDIYTGTLKRISSPDAATVVFELCEPDVAFPARLASPTLAINDTAWLETRIDPDRSNEQAIVAEVNGTGPFRLEAWNRGSDITLVRHDAYWGPRARTELLVFRWDQTPARRVSELAAGTVDGVDAVDPGDVDAVAADPDLRLVPRGGLNIAYLGFNDAYAPFDDLGVRRAIAMAIDRTALLEVGFPPGSEVASHITPCSIPGGCEGTGWWEYDPAGARDLLTQSGYAEGFSTTIHIGDTPRDYLPDPMAVAVEVQRQLRANLAIETTIETRPFDEYVTAAESGKLSGIHLLGTRARYPDVTSFLEVLLGPGAPREFGTRSPDITRPISRGAATVDEAARAKAYAGANTQIRSRVPLIPLVHVGGMTAYRADVRGSHASPLGLDWFAAMTPGDRTQVSWMQATEPAGLYCADESDPDTLRVCAQLGEGLYGASVGSAAVTPTLAEGCTPDAELTTWTCILRSDVRFHDGARLDASDVVLSFAVQWDAEHPLHRAREGSFERFASLFGGFLNPRLP
jgi:ABC-type transport system substrate-binding protein